jgi:hypothetical protein
MNYELEKVSKRKQESRLIICLPILLIAYPNSSCGILVISFHSKTRAEREGLFSLSPAIIGGRDSGGSVCGQDIVKGFEFLIRKKRKPKIQLCVKDESSNKIKSIIMGTSGIHLGWIRSRVGFICIDLCPFHLGNLDGIPAHCSGSG